MLYSLYDAFIVICAIAILFDQFITIESKITNCEIFAFCPKKTQIDENNEKRKNENDLQLPLKTYMLTILVWALILIQMLLHS